MKTEIQKLQDDIFNWQEKTFPKSSGLSKLVGARREIGELLNNPSDRMEWADIMVYFLGAAKSHGHSTTDLIRYTKEKMKINKKRQWGRPDRHGVYHHTGK